MGSFGAVWAAEKEGSGKLAIKEIICSSQADLLNALFEGHLLRTLGGGSQGEELAQGAALACEGRLPALVACETQQLAAETWRIRLAMTRIHGEPLDSFLRRRQQQMERLDRSPSQLRRQVLEACNFGRELLAQLSPAFEHISAVTFHRDVNAHNILIEGGDDDNPRFGLVDFGLAVDVLCWQRCEDPNSPTSRPSRVGQDGACTWHHLDVGGDCRYWPVSAWVQFLLGWTELEAQPPLAFEYKSQLDLHSLGLTALQVVAEMLPLFPEPSFSSHLGGEDPAHGAGAFLKEICALRLAWEQYWSIVSPLHGRLMDIFHTAGDWDALKTDCLEQGVHRTIAEQLATLRHALRNAHKACRSAPPEAGVAGFTGLFVALLALVSSGVGDDDHMEGPAKWRAVSSRLGAGSGGSSADMSASRDGAVNSRASTVSSMGHISLSEKLGCLADELRATPAPPSSQLAVAQLQQEIAQLRSPLSSSERAQLQQTHGACGDDLMLRLTHLRSRVDWLAQEMAKIGEKGGDKDRREPRRGLHGAGAFANASLTENVTLG